MTAGPGNEAAGTAPPFALEDVPPTLLVALALVGAGGMVVVAVLVSMVTVPADVAASFDVGILQRVQLGARFVDIGVVLLVPAAVLLTGWVEPGGTVTSSDLRMTRIVLTGAPAVGAALALVVFLRLVADLVGGDLVGPSRAGAVVYDLACLLVAGVGASWAYLALLACQPKPRPNPPAPPASAPSGFPQGPPTPSGPPPPPSA